MGFGKKTDFETGKTIDLDKTYLNIIKPAADQAGYQCVRADEIDDSGLIDRSMYALLLRADLVVADISTHNPNALYELGVRHAARPYSTIIIRDRTEKKIPFDLDHTRIFQYEHLGKDIGADEAKRCTDELASKMLKLKAAAAADSPMYEMLSTVTPPTISEEEFKQILGELAERENNIFALRAGAEELMAKNDFASAAVKWRKAGELSDGDSFFVQQEALATYKSAGAEDITPLTDALRIIGKLDPDNSNDPETLGITGAIYKRIFLRTGREDALERASRYYKHGFVVANDYYNGENYANCLDMAFDIASQADLKTYLRIESEKTRQSIVDRLSKLDDSEIAIMPDALWVFATLSNCYLALRNCDKAKSFEDKFLDLKPLDWQIETFNQTKDDIEKREKLRHGN